MDGKIRHKCADGSEVILDAHPTIKNHATLALRQWTTMDSGAQNRGESTVLLHVSHSNLARHFHELRLDLHMTVGALKEKLRSHTGTGSAHAYLTLLDDANQPVSCAGWRAPFPYCKLRAQLKLRRVTRATMGEGLCTRHVGMWFSTAVVARKSSSAGRTRGIARCAPSVLDAPTFCLPVPVRMPVRIGSWPRR